MYDDEFAGQGGSYSQDPVTGKRTRIEEPTLDSSPAVMVAAPVADESAPLTPVAKNKKSAPINPPAQGV